MSQYVTIPTQFRDQEALIAALHTLGYGDVEVHAAPAVLIGYDGRPRHDAEGQEIRAEIVIRRQHLWRSANDIGLARTPAGTWQLYFSEYDQQVRPDWPGLLRQQYASQVIQRQAQRHGKACTATRLADGRIHVRIAV